MLARLLWTGVLIFGGLLLYAGIRGYMTADSTMGNSLQPSAAMLGMMLRLFAMVSICVGAIMAGLSAYRIFSTASFRPPKRWHDVELRDEEDEESKR